MKNLTSLAFVSSMLWLYEWAHFSTQSSIYINRLFAPFLAFIHNLLTECSHFYLLILFFSIIAYNSGWNWVVIITTTIYVRMQVNNIFFKYIFFLYEVRENETCTNFLFILIDCIVLNVILILLDLLYFYAKICANFEACSLKIQNRNV